MHVGQEIFIISCLVRLTNQITSALRRNPPEDQVTSGQKPSTKIIYIVLQTLVGLF